MIGGAVTHPTATANQQPPKRPTVKVGRFFTPIARQEFQGNAILAPAGKSGMSISGIPLEACEYIVNDKSALEWDMECGQ